MVVKHPVNWPTTIRARCLSRACVAAICCVVALAGCSDPSSNNGAEDAGYDFGNGDDDTSNGPTWETSVVATEDAGLQPALAVSSSGTVAMAYFAPNAVEGERCTELGIDSPPNKSFYPLFYAEWDGSGVSEDAWSVEKIRDILLVGSPSGVDMVFDADTPKVVTMTGEPIERYRYCGANDVGVLSRNGGSWSADVAVAESGEAATGDQASDFGSVVGYWPAAAMSPDGALGIIYKDVHSGSLQRDDLARADLEFVEGSSGSWSPQPVDAGRGAGNYNDLTFDADGVPWSAYFNPTENNQDPRLGVFVTRWSEAEQDWERVRLFDKITDNGPSLVVHPDDGYARVVYYESNDGFPELATQVSGEFTSIQNGWEFDDIGDAQYDEGYQTSLAVSPNGNLAVAYYRCARIERGIGQCAAEDDALIFAWEDAGDWTHEVVDAGGEGLCGTNPSLTFDADGRAVIGYECETLVDGTLVPEVKFARRQALP